MLDELDPRQISEKDNAEQHHLMLSITTATTNSSFTFSLLLSLSDFHGLGKANEKNKPVSK